mmetsp:Transcript_1462/g.3495  ORF Transcript_1462/g.3495 Transcript_1462/m.3495 type:complete len:203 (+) Transcript_1462:519-1127(+)
MDVRDAPEALASDADPSSSTPPPGRRLTTRAVDVGLAPPPSSFVIVFLRMSTSLPLRYRCFSFFLPSLTTPCALPRRSLHSPSSSRPIRPYPLLAMYPTASSRPLKYILVSRSSLTKKLARLYPLEIVAILVRGFDRSADVSGSPGGEEEEEDDGRSRRLFRGRSAGGSHDPPPSPPPLPDASRPPPSPSRGPDPPRDDRPS